MNLWLSTFAHRIALAWWIFAGACLVILLVGVLTVTLQSLKAIFNNPIQSLGSE